MNRALWYDYFFQLPKDSNGREEFWRVMLGKRFTGGAVIRKTFPSYQKAKEWVEAQNAPKEQHGASFYDLTPAQLAEARNAFQRLNALDAAPKPTLTDALSFFIKHAMPTGGMRTFGELAEEFITSRTSMNCKEKTMTQYESYFHVLTEEFGELKLHELRRQDIEDWLSDSPWSPRTRKNYLTTLTTFFNFAVTREYCGSNPAVSIPRPILDDKPPGILTPAQAIALLDTALGCTPQLIPAITIGLFAGLRRSEICTLDWNEIDLARGTIEVLASKAKTRRRRLATIQPNLAEWLKPYAVQEGPVAPDVDIFGERLRHLIDGRPPNGDDPGRPPVVAEWPHNALRHSFCSYFFGKTKNENLTSAEMGNSPAVVFKCYRAVVRPEAVEAYWNIYPTQKLNVIPMPKACYT